MKILQVTPRYPPHTGGVETHVKELSERLVQRGHEVTVVTADAGRDVSRRETRNGVVVRRCRSVAPDDAFHLAPGVSRIVARTKGDIVHAHNYHSLPMLFAAVGVTDARFVVTPHYHGESASTVRNGLLSLYRPLGGWALARADATIAVSEWERERLRIDFGVRASVVPNGLDVAKFANAVPEKRDRPYLLCVGRLEEYKGVQHVIRALPALPEYDLVVAGEGPYREQLADIAVEVGVADRVQFLGYVTEQRLPGLYAAAEVHVTLSEFEAYGMTVGEALAAGTPCVVREEGALLDWTDRPGVVGLETTTPADLRSAVCCAASRTPEGTFPTWVDVTDSISEEYARIL